MRLRDLRQREAARKRCRLGWDRGYSGPRDLRRGLPALPLESQNLRSRGRRSAARTGLHYPVVRGVPPNGRKRNRPARARRRPGGTRAKEFGFSSPQLTPAKPMAFFVPALEASHAQGRTRLRGGSGHRRFTGNVRTQARCHDPSVLARPVCLLRAKRGFIGPLAVRV